MSDISGARLAALSILMQGAATRLQRRTGFGRRVSRSFLVLAALGSIATPRLDGQAVHSTFGPADSYKTGIGCCEQWVVQYPQWMAASFTYSGPSGLQLARVRFAAYFGSGGATSPTASFWAGSGSGGTTLIESWALTGYPTNVDQIFSLASITGTAFVAGETYWLRLATAIDGTTGAWRWNDQSLLGIHASYDQGATWNTYPGLSAPAWDVSAVSTVVPEPESLALLATGLGGLLAASFYHRRRRGWPR